MKNSKKALITSGLLVAVAAMSIAPTISWLSARTDTVVNTFAGGAISLTLDEAKVDADGDPVPDADRVTENSYKYSPGATLTKDPTVTVLANSDECYVFLMVENDLDPNYFTTDYDEDGVWKSVATKDSGIVNDLVSDATLYMYVGTDSHTVAQSDEAQVLPAIFTQVTVSEDLTGTEIAEMGEKELKVTAYAVQAAEIEEDVAIDMAIAEFNSLAAASTD